MVSIAVMAGGALVNALAFSGTNYLFGMLGGAERKRHDLAMEKLSKARGEYSRKSHQRLDFINQSLQQQRHATQTFSNLDVAMREYYKVTGAKLLELEPLKLSDYYVPSQAQKDGEIAFIIGGMALVGIVAYKYA